MADENFKRSVLMAHISLITIAAFLIVLIFSVAGMIGTNPIAQIIINNYDQIVTILVIVGVRLSVIGIIGVSIGWGLFSGRSWAWYLSL